MELGYSLILHFSILYLDQNLNLYLLVDRGMYALQVLKFVQILWEFSI
jgi:hypothetical protein